MALNEVKSTPAHQLTKREATQGRVIKLSRQSKAIAAGIMNKADRRHYLNMMLMATRIYNNRLSMTKTPRDNSPPAAE